MSKSSHITFSREHMGRSSGEKEVDTYRQKSDSSKVEKIDHNTVTPGHGNDSVEIKVNVNTGK
jgi:hypothetical protein